MKLAVITGATSGIGEAYARRLSKDGYDLVLVGRQKERLGMLAKELNSKVNVVICDLSSEDQVRRLAKSIKSKPIEILINNAGFGSRGYFNQLDIENQVEMIKVHVNATVRLTRAVLPGMIDAKKGNVINVCSIAGIIPWKGNVTYSSTKAYLIMFSNIVFQEVRRFGIKVQALCPGLVRTSFHRKLDNRHKGYEPSLKMAWLMPDQVVEYSLSKLKGNKVVVIPGFFNKVMVFLLKRRLIFWLMNRKR